MKKSDYLPYLRTLRHVPDDVILSVATRDLDLSTRSTCICGWVMREAMARVAGKDAADMKLLPQSVNEELAYKFGGDLLDWWDIYYGVVDDRAPLIERAFVERVMEAAL